MEQQVLADELPELFLGAQRVEPVTALAQLRDVLLPDPRRRPPGGVALEEGAQVVEVDQVVRRVHAYHRSRFGVASTWPSTWSISSASRTGVRLIPSCRASSSSFSRCPGSSRPSRIASLISSVAATLAFRTSPSPSPIVPATERKYSMQSGTPTP